MKATKVTNESNKSDATILSIVEDSESKEREQPSPANNNNKCNSHSTTNERKSASINKRIEGILQKGMNIKRTEVEEEGSLHAINSNCTTRPPTTIKHQSR